MKNIFGKKAVIIHYIWVVDWFGSLENQKSFLRFEICCSEKVRTFGSFLSCYLQYSMVLIQQVSILYHMLFCIICYYCFYKMFEKNDG